MCEYYYYFEDFLTEMDYDFEQPKESRPSNYLDEPDEEVDMFDNDLELMTWLENNDKETLFKFGLIKFIKEVKDNIDGTGGNPKNLIDPYDEEDWNE